MEEEKKSCLRRKIFLGGDDLTKLDEKFHSLTSFTTSRAISTRIGVERGSEAVIHCSMEGVEAPRFRCNLSESHSQQERRHFAC